jgi:hypothetical protein
MICGVVAGELRSYGELMEGRVAGAVSAGGLESLPWLVVDAASREVEPVSRYLRDLPLGDSFSALVKPVTGMPSVLVRRRGGSRSRWLCASSHL